MSLKWNFRSFGRGESGKGGKRGRRGIFGETDGGGNGSKCNAWFGAKIDGAGLLVITNY